MNEAELISAVKAAPDDDGPRLVLADFWTSKGDPRGEFITLQCRLAAAKDDEARRKLRIAENKLLKEHQPAWTKDFLAAAPASSPLRANKIVFHRGFLEEAALPLSALDELAPYFAAAPLLRRLRIDAPGPREEPQPPPSLTGKLDAPGLRGVRALDLRVAGGGDLAALAVAQTAQLGGLRELKMEASSWAVPGYVFFTGDPATHLLGSVGARALAQSPHLTSLTRLELAQNAIGSAGVAELVKAPWKLEHLDVSMNQLDDGALLAIAAAPSLSGLRFLAVGGGNFTPKGLATLAKSKVLTALETLEFNGAQVGAEGLAAFLRALALPRLTALGLSNTGLGDAGAKLLASTKTQLTSLELQDNGITQAGCLALAESKHLGGLQRLLLNDAWLGKKANVERLAASPALTNCKVYVKGTLISGKAKKEAKTVAKTSAKTKKK